MTGRRKTIYAYVEEDTLLAVDRLLARRKPTISRSQLVDYLLADYVRREGEGLNGHNDRANSG